MKKRTIKQIAKDVEPRDRKEVIFLLENPQFERMPCQTFSEFVDNPEYLGIGEDTYKKVKSEGDLIWRGIMNKTITEAVLLWGIGSGKSFLCSILSLLYVHYLLCLKDPHAHFGLNNDKPIAVVNMGPSATQAKNVVFASVRKLIENSFFFQNYKPKILQTEVKFEKKNITFYSGNSKETMPLGMNVLYGALDEAAWYLDNENKSNAKDVYNTLKNRIISRFGDSGFMFLISAPRYVDDFINKKHEASKDISYVHTSMYKTWEVKDRDKMSEETFDFIVSKDDKGEPLEIWEKIPVDFQKSFEMNPEKAMRDFGARPSLVLEAFDRDADVVTRICNEKENPVNERGQLKEWFRCKDNEPRYIHIDLAKNKDACGFAMGKMTGEEEVEGERRISAEIELIMRITAPPNDEIRFSDVRQIVYDLNDRGFNVFEVSYDGWQSVDSIQILKDKGFNAYTLSVDRNTSAYDTLKEMMHTGRLDIYKHDYFIKEYKRLELVKGRKVDHPTSGSKDVADAISGVCEMIVGPRDKRRGAAGFFGFMKRKQAETKEVKTMDYWLGLYNDQK